MSHKFTTTPPQHQIPINAQQFYPFGVCCLTQKRQLVGHHTRGCVTHSHPDTRTLIQSALAALTENPHSKRNKSAWITWLSVVARGGAKCSAPHLIPRFLMWIYFAPRCIVSLSSGAVCDSIVRLNGVAKFLQLGRGEFASSLYMHTYIISTRSLWFYDARLTQQHADGDAKWVWARHYFKFAPTGVQDARFRREESISRRHCEKLVNCSCNVVRSALS